MGDAKLTRNLAFGAVVGAFLCGASAAASADTRPPPSSLAPLISGLIAEYQGRGDFQFPAIADEDVDALAAGEPVVIPFDAPGAAEGKDVDAMRALGLQVIDAPRLLVWLAMLSGSDGQHGRFTRATLSRDTAGTFVRYQYMDLPWPFKSRHWVVVCDKNVELAQASQGRIWEHRWSLYPNGQDVLDGAYRSGRIPALTRESLDDAVYLPVNRGAWILFDLGAGRTLVGAYLDVDFGGHFPDGLVRMFAKRQLRASLESLTSASRRRYLEYDEAPVLYDGYGAPISKQDAVEAAANPDAPRLVKASYRADASGRP